jgi:hypothetical protein
MSGRHLRMSNYATFDPGPDTGPCTVCGAPTSPLVREIVRPGEDLWEFGCPEHAPDMHAAIAVAHRQGARFHTYARLNGMSSRLTLSPEEYVGRHGHGWLVGGPPVIDDDDTDAPPGLAEWSRQVHQLLSDLPFRLELQRRYLTPEEIEAIAEAERAEMAFYLDEASARPPSADAHRRSLGGHSGTHWDRFRSAITRAGRAFKRD